MFVTAPGDQIVDQFAVFEDDGFTKHSGLVQGSGDFVVFSWLDGAVSALSVVVTEIGTSGEYKMVYTPPTSGYFKIAVFVPFTEEFLISTALVGSSADLVGVKADLDRILSLLHYNSMLDKHVYDANDQLLSARMRRFSTPSNIPTTPGGNELTGLKHEHEVAAEYSANNRATSFTLKKVL